MADLPSMIGPYRVVRRLGEGGMGAVYEAVHEAIERRVAIKVLHSEFASNAEFTARFFNEARAVNRVEHPGLVQISDYGQQEGGTAYIVMEFLRGESLAQRIARSGGKLTTPEVINLSRQIAEALAAAHEKNIVHRDLKPENVMLVPEPHMPGGERSKLLDFGIAKVSDQGERPMVQTKTDQFMGTPLYMSPEQCEGAGRVDVKSDVYSLGVMMFEMLSGRLPFVSDAPGKILGMHILTPPPILKELAPEVPAGLADLVQRLLIKERETRPSMANVVTELAAMAELYPVTKPQVPPPQVSPPQVVEIAVDPLLRTALAPSTLGAAASHAVSKPSRRWRVLALAIAGTGLICSGAVFVLLRTSPRFAVAVERLRHAAHLVAHAADTGSDPSLSLPTTSPAGVAATPTPTPAVDAPPSTAAQLAAGSPGLPGPAGGPVSPSTTPTTQPGSPASSAGTTVPAPATATTQKVAANNSAPAKAQSAKPAAKKYVAPKRSHGKVWKSIKRKVYRRWRR